MPTPSWDLAITVFFLMGIAFGYILQRDKIVATLLSVYVGLIITQAVSGNIQSFIQGESTFSNMWIRSNANPFTVRAVIFIAVIMLVSAKSGISAGRSKGLLSPIEVIIYSIFTSGLILSSLFYFMPAESREAFVMSSRMAKLVINNYVWWIVLPIIFMIVAGFFRRSSSSSD